MLGKMAKFAMKIARRMSNDPEVESIANETAMRAVTSYDPARCDNIHRWVAYCVKRDVWCYWRKLKARREEYKTEEWWDRAGMARVNAEHDQRVSDDDWRLLCEYFILRWPLDVVASRHGVTVYRVREMLNAARARFLESHGDYEPEEEVLFQMTDDAPQGEVRADYHGSASRDDV